MTPPGPLKGRPCSVCTHPQTREIATALLAGGTVRDVGRRYGIAASTLARHQRMHLLPRLTAAETTAPARIQAMESREERLDVLRAMYALYDRAIGLLDKAEAAKDLPSALRGIREVRESLALIGRLDGSLDGPVAPQGGNVVVQVQYIDKAVITPAAPRLLESGEDD